VFINGVMKLIRMKLSAKYICFYFYSYSYRSRPIPIPVPRPITIARPIHIPKLIFILIPRFRPIPIPIPKTIINALMKLGLEQRRQLYI